MHIFLTQVSFYNIIIYYYAIYRILGMYTEWYTHNNLLVYFEYLLLNCIYYELKSWWW